MAILENVILNAASALHNIYTDNFSDTYFNKHTSIGSKETSDSPDPEAPSAKIDLYSIDLPEIEEKYDDNYSLAKSREYRTRGYLGLICAVHVISFLDGKEKLRTGWRKEYMKCSNMISRTLGFCDLYEISGMQNYDPSDYWFSSNKEQPIVTKSIMDKALELYPISKETAALSSYNWDNITERFDPGFKEDVVVVEDSDEVPFDDSSVQVMDVEEDVKKSSKKKAEIVVVEADSNKEKEPDKSEEKPVAAKEKKEKKKEVVKPLITSPSGMKFLDLTADQPISERDQTTFDKLFGKYIDGLKYELHRFQGGSIQCVIYDTSVSYYVLNIDPGLLIGDGWNVMGTYLTGNPAQPYDTIPVSASDEDICEKIFKARGYVLTPAEVERCSKRMFADQRIYTYIDMKGMHSQIKRMTQDEFIQLGETLSLAVENIIKKDPTNTGRYRFLEYKDPKHFTLISDAKCHAPFPGATLYNITEKTISINDATVTVDNNSEDAA